MSDRKLPPVARELIAAKKFLSDLNNWCPEGVGFNGKDGHKLCAVRAACQFSKGVSAAELLTKVAVSVFSIAASGVNGMGHAAVMQLYDHAIARAIKEGK